MLNPRFTSSQVAGRMLAAICSSATCANKSFADANPELFAALEEFGQALLSKHGWEIKVAADGDEA